MALLYLPLLIMLGLIVLDRGARGRWPVVASLAGAFTMASGRARCGAFLLLLSATLHVALIPAHQSDRVTAVLFAVDALALTAAAVAMVTRGDWRWPVACLLLAGLAAYTGYVLTGHETVDATGLLTKSIELLALGLAVVPVPNLSLGGGLTRRRATPTSTFTQP